MTRLVLRARPRSALVDELVRIQVSGARPHGRVSISAETTGAQREVWRSMASFRADDLGHVDLSTQDPLEGSYSRADPMGLFWSMRPASVAERLLPQPGCCSVPVVLKAMDEEGHAACLVVTRQFRRPEVERAEVRADGLVGTFFQPSGGAQAQGVLVLGGSDGGIPEDLAGLLASRHLAVLGLTYFGVEPLPRELVEIPLDYVEAAIHWLRSKDSVRRGRIHVVGRSRGGELALLAGALLPATGSVVAYVPSGLTWWGWTSQGWSSSPAWTYRGREMRCPGRAPQAGMKGTTGPTFFHQVIRARPAESQAAAIPVERIDGDVLLISAGRDEVWPSTTLAVIAGERRAKKGRSCRHLDYPAAGHMIGYPHVPTTVAAAVDNETGRQIDFGGTAEANAAANADSWPYVLRVLGARSW
jgi:dienelactone hydrolase